MIGCGAYSPLTGFMNRDDYLSVVYYMRLETGLPWSIPITLSVSRDFAKTLKEGMELALVDPGGQALGVLEVQDVYEYDKETEASLVYRTREEKHPGVAYLLSQEEVLVGGQVTAFHRQLDGIYEPYIQKPAQSRQAFAEAGWRTVVGFQTRNPIHRAHEYIQKCALEVVDGLFIHPLVGETQASDIPADVRMLCYEALIQEYYPKGRVILGVLPAFMRYAGPREAIFHAIMRQNYGCSHFIVGRDHAGVGSYYGPFDAHYIFNEFAPGELGIQPLFFDNAFYCTRCDTMATSKTCPHEDDCRVSLSGTQVRQMLNEGKEPPPEFTRRGCLDPGRIHAGSRAPTPA
jgi:sulfate adenylyltransferase